MKLWIALLLALCALERAQANVAHRRHKHHVNDVAADVEAEVEREHKLLIECQNEDYRTYIKCLKRDKRQHYNDNSGQRNCLSECFETNCTTTACIQDCHRRCRTKLTFTKTVETSYDCNDDSCKNGAAAPSFHANITIQNIPPNNTNYRTFDGPGENMTVPKIEIHNEIVNTVGSASSDCPCPSYGCSCVGNPWQTLPQITIGFGGGGSPGGCQFWPCLPQRFPPSPPAQPLPLPTTDCAICFFYQYRCDPGCFPGRNITQASTTAQKRTY